MLRDHKVSPFLVNGQRSIAGDDHAVRAEGVLLLYVQGIYGQRKSEDPVGEAKGIVGELQRFLQILVGYAICVGVEVTMDCVDHVAGHALGL